ncbi:hypothetical protein ISF6_2791 [Piscinibacter sakaiensis]|uniref:Uncharacterized protein n=1 Tax=Piscinibacter sakaiensis TaxID=1547922 RepID=A0A0K8NUK4_PISS1|nr:hypothetical protein ISF6_2791 [Piscinibacter sakaiensis]
MLPPAPGAVAGTHPPLGVVGWCADHPHLVPLRGQPGRQLAGDLADARGLGREVDAVQKKLHCNCLVERASLESRRPCRRRWAGRCKTRRPCRAAAQGSHALCLVWRVPLERGARFKRRPGSSSKCRAAEGHVR